MKTHIDPPPRFVLDSGALIQLERGNQLVIDVLDRAINGAAEVVIPQTVIAEVWRGGPRQARLAAFLKTTVKARRRMASMTIDELSLRRAKEIGITIGSCGHDDIVDVNVALCARDSRGEINAIVITADRNHITRVDESLKEVILDV